MWTDTDRGVVKREVEEVKPRDIEVKVGDITIKMDKSCFEWERSDKETQVGIDWTVSWLKIHAASIGLASSNRLVFKECEMIEAVAKKLLELVTQRKVEA